MVDRGIQLWVERGCGEIQVKHEMHCMMWNGREDERLLVVENGEHLR